MARPGCKPRPVAERFWEKVQPVMGCWIWTACRNDAGYGVILIGSKVKGCERRATLAHRWAYESLAGPIPEGLCIDHLCRVRCCVNPAHMEPVTLAENLRRGDHTSVLADRNRAKTHCRHGHPYSGDNVYRRPGGGRTCRTCHRANEAKYRAERKGARLAS